MPGSTPGSAARLLTVTLALGACDRLAISGAPCPCPEGWACNPVTAQCLPADAACVNPLAPTVQPLFADAPHWNDRRRADGSACLDDDTWSRCQPVGTMVRVGLSPLRDCAGLVITDALQAFRWSCEPGADGVVAIGRLAPSGRLSDLMDVEHGLWLANAVQVADANCVLAQTAAQTWWSEPIVIVEATTRQLDADDTVYLVNSDTENDGITIAADNVALVVARQATLRATATPGGGCILRGGNYDALVCADGVDNLWLEGTFSGQGLMPRLNDIVALRLARHAQVRGVVAEGALLRGLLAEGVAGSRFDGLSFFDNGEGTTGGGFQIHDLATQVTAGNLFANIVAAYNARGAIYGSAGDNLLLDVRVFANAHEGFFMSGALGGLRLVGALAVNNGGPGLGVWSEARAPGPFVQHFTALNNLHAGIFISGNGGVVEAATFLNLLLVNNSGRGFDADNLEGSVLGWVFSSDNDGGTLRAPGGDNALVGPLWTTGAVYCAGAGSSALLDSACGTPIELSGHVRDLLAVTGSASQDATPYDEIESRRPGEPWRAWGPAPAETFPSASARGPCLPGNLCALWDYALSNEDETARLLFGALQTNCTPPSTAAWYTPTGVATPVLVAGREVLSDGGIDVAGNGDGLCQPNERCTWSANVGAYPGQGAAVGPCQLHLGEPAASVTLVGYAEVSR